ncbi:MAG TPA: ion transporter [Solirubrobacter sp.]|nr:ion transporter [Solirubrobacter sp.]
MAERCRRIVDSSWFDPLMLVFIVINAVVLGLGTYPSIDEDIGDQLELANNVILGIFVVELLIRMAAYGRHLGDFFKSGWNVFDFVVIGGSLLPGLRENVTLLRVLRLLRIVRAVRLLPDLRILTIAVARSVPGVASLAGLTLLLVYIYGMIGWLIFKDDDPASFGDIGQAMLTMFVMLSLENLPDYIEMGQQVSDWTLLFFISYVLLASFLILNLFIGIVINSMEEAREMELHRAERQLLDEDPDNDERAHQVILSERLHALKKAVEALEREVIAQRRGH